MPSKDALKLSVTSFMRSGVIYTECGSRSRSIDRMAVSASSDESTSSTYRSVMTWKAFSSF